MLAGLVLACAAEPANGPKYVSEKPLYAKMVLSEDGSNVLTLAFDEFRGTGTGYDTVYGDSQGA